MNSLVPTMTKMVGTTRAIGKRENIVEWNFLTCPEQTGLNIAMDGKILINMEKMAVGQGFEPREGY